jgi:hypothetical protein
MDDEEKRKKEMLLALGFPPRPIPGSVIDLDKVLERCDFQTNQVSVSIRTK